MIQITDKAACCGCTACEAICPTDAISMQPDALGFLYPKVNAEKCINCSLCEKVCAFHPNYSKEGNLPAPDVYAVRHKSIEQIERSRSGAMFVALSDFILAKGGVVYGAGYTDHFRVVHKRAVNTEQRDEFRGSKYVQSDLNTVFHQVKLDLHEGNWVLFSGTPCQTAGLKSFLSLSRTDSSKLYVVDIVCHGVPAPYFWRDYLAYIEKREGQSVVAVDFRDKKTFGWTAHKESFVFADGRKCIENTYTYTFYEHIMFRHSCSNCHFCNFIRPSDITLADFWGWQKVKPQLNADDKGVSLVLVNTAKGQVWFDHIKEDLTYISTDKETCLQPNLSQPSVPHPLREQFEKDYINKGFKYILCRYADKGWRYKLLRLKQKSKTAIRLAKHILTR